MLALALASSWGTANASDVLVTLNGPTGSGFGNAVTFLGDLNRDGADDFAIGAPNHDGAGTDAGMVRVVSGKDYTPLWEGYGHLPHRRLGTRLVNAGDVNKDGYPDLMAAGTGGDTGYVDVYSGEWIARTAAGETPDSNLLLHRIAGLQIGESFAEALLGDLNMDNDGYDDFLVGSPDYDSGGLVDSGVVRAYSGRWGTLLWESYGTGGSGHYGTSLAKIRPDNAYDTDGLQDYVVGAPGSDEIAILSGPTGQLLATIPWQSGTGFGTALAVPGDLTGDGRDEIVATAPWSDITPGFGTEGAVVIVASESGTCTLIDGDATTLGLGVQCSAAGDVNGDNVPDFGVAALGGSPRLYSGADCSLLETLSASTAAGIVVGSGDVNEDAHPDVLTGEPLQDRVIVHSPADLVIPAFVEYAWLVGTVYNPRARMTLRYPSYGLSAGDQLAIELEYDHGGGFAGASTESLTLPPAPNAQVELTLKWTWTTGVPFSVANPHRYRVRMVVNGISGPWSEAAAAHPAADRIKGVESSFPGDGWVDTVDLAAWVSSFGWSEGDAKYDPLSDFIHMESPSIVDVVDLGAWVNWRTAINGF